MNDNNDFKSWYLENATLFEELHNKNSVLFYHVKDIIDSLAYINDMIDNDNASSELYDIFDTGYAYLYAYINELKIYLNNYFDNDMNELLKYEVFLRYCFYLNDIKDLLIDENIYNGDIKEEIDYILNDIEEVLKKNKLKDEMLLDEYDSRMEIVIPKDKHIQTIPEIFSTVVDNLEV